MGKTLLQGKLNVQQGFNRHDLELSSLSQGIYHIVISNETGLLFQSRFLKK